MITTLYHNPQCTKSRLTLELLKSKGIEPEIILYLVTPPSIETLKNIQKMLGFDSAVQMMRPQEEMFKTLQLENASEAQLFEAMESHPKLIERPIFFINEKAAIGRPPENILPLLP